MKLSEALRIGATKRPQCKVDFFRNGGSCAIGAIIEGANIPHGDYEWEMAYELLERYPELDLMVEYPSLTPCNEPDSMQLFNAIWYLNDEANKTREEIADMLEKAGF